MLNKTTLSFTVLLTTLTLAGVSIADDPADFEQTTWVLCPNVRPNPISATAPVWDWGFFSVDFNDDGTLTMQDEEGHTVHGTFDFDSKGHLAIELSQEELEELYIAHLSDLFDGAYLTWEVNDLSVSTGAKAVYHNGRITLTVRLKFSGMLHIQVGGISVDTRISQPVVIAGDHPVNGASWGTQWTIQARATGHTKKLKPSEMLTLKLTLGDYPGSGLGINEYELYDVSGDQPAILASGDFCRHKCKIELSITDPDAAALLEDVFHQAVQDSPDVELLTVDRTRSRLAGTLPKPTVIRLFDTTRFTTDLELKAGGTVETQGIMRLTGRGTPSN